MFYFDLATREWDNYVVAIFLARVNLLVLYAILTQRLK